MRGSSWTREEAELLLESMAGPVRTIPFKYGWVAVPTKTEAIGDSEAIILGRRRMSRIERRM